MKLHMIKDHIALIFASALLCGTANAGATVNDTCKENTNPHDIDTLSAEFVPGSDPTLDEIVVDMLLCSAPSNKKQSKYRVNFDHTSPYAVDADRNGDTLVDELDDCVTTSDSGMMYKGNGDTTGPGSIEVAGNKITYTVLVDDLSLDLETDDTVYIWADTQKKGIEDRAPDTDDADGCAKPEIESETLVLLLSTGSETQCEEREAAIAQCKVDFDPAACNGGFACEYAVQYEQDNCIADARTATPDCSPCGETRAIGNAQCEIDFDPAGCFGDLFCENLTQVNQDNCKANVETAFQSCTTCEAGCASTQDTTVAQCEIDFDPAVCFGDLFCENFTQVNQGDCKADAENTYQSCATACAVIP